MMRIDPTARGTFFRVATPADRTYAKGDRVTLRGCFYFDDPRCTRTGTVVEAHEPLGGYLVKHDAFGPDGRECVYGWMRSELQPADESPLPALPIEPLGRAILRLLSLEGDAS